MALQNFFATKLFTDIGASDTTITLETVPTATSGRLVLEARNATQREIIKYTGVSGNTITGVTRGQGGTTAKPHLKNALVEMNAMAEDIQDLYDAFASFAASANDWRVAPGFTATSIVHNGNRNYTINTSTDLTAIVSKGMRGKAIRTTAAPTMCAALNGTNQYFSKTTPAGMTFTDDFTVSAWVKLSSYATAGVILSRSNGTSGFMLYSDTTGQINLIGYNGGAGNNSKVVSYQSIPLNKWVHITAQLDMSAFTATTTTSYIMIDGVDVPSSVTRGGTNPTALIQAGNLEIGSWSGGLLPFAGKIAQVAIFSAKVTQATMRGYISQGLTGTEPTLVSAYSLSNSLNDLNTTNANNLTVNNGATTTNADAPFALNDKGVPTGNTDCFIFHDVTPTSINVQVPEGCTLPTTGSLTSLSYSGVKSPYGFPGQRDKWRLKFIDKRLMALSATPTGNVWYNSGGTLGSPQVVLPVGEWDLGWSARPYYYRIGSTSADMFITLSTSTSAEVDPEMTACCDIEAPSGTLAARASLSRSKPVSVATVTTMYLLCKTTAANDIGYQGLSHPVLITADNTLL